MGIPHRMTPLEILLTDVAEIKEEHRRRKRELGLPQDEE